MGSFILVVLCLCRHFYWISFVLNLCSFACLCSFMCFCGFPSFCYSVAYLCGHYELLRDCLVNLTNKNKKHPLHTGFLMLTDQLPINFLSWWGRAGSCSGAGCVIPCSTSGPLSHQDPLKRSELMRFSCHLWQALICFHSASHHSFKDEWIISLRGSKKISVLPKNDWHPKIVDPRRFCFS